MLIITFSLSLLQNVSIIFADEPTSGLDASAAAVVMRGLKRIAQSGRAVCCTIHQPSIAIFNGFDELLLLKRGGETVFFGELGNHSSSLIHYLESFEATPKIHPGENPATWMLTTIGAGSSSSNSPPFDYAGSYARSTLRKSCIERIEKICSDATVENKLEFSHEYASSYQTQASAVFSRTMTVYYRSPNYNVTRVMVAIVGKFSTEAHCNFQSFLI
jgi:ABC-type multidrug transport system ATPase subunit